MFTDADVPGVWVTEIGWTEPVVAGVESEVSWTVGGVTDVVMDIGTVVGSSVTASVGTENGKQDYSLFFHLGNEWRCNVM